MVITVIKYDRIRQITALSDHIIEKRDLRIKAVFTQNESAIALKEYTKNTHIFAFIFTITKVNNTMNPTWQEKSVSFSLSHSLDVNEP